MLHFKEIRTADTELSSLSVSTLPFCLTCKMGLQDSYKIFFVTCAEFNSWVQPYSKALCHFFFFPSCSSRLNPFDKAMIGNRRLALRELAHRNLSSPSPGNQGVKMTDMDAPSMIGDLKKKKKILDAVYRAALFGWGRIAAGSKFLLTTSSCWQVAFRTGWACKFSRGSYLSECLLFFFIQVTADWLLCKILRLEKFQRENRSFV